MLVVPETSHSLSHTRLHTHTHRVHTHTSARLATQDTIRKPRVPRVHPRWGVDTNPHYAPTHTHTHIPHSTHSTEKTVPKKESSFEFWHSSTVCELCVRNTHTHTHTHTHHSRDTHTHTHKHTHTHHTFPFIILCSRYTVRMCLHADETAYFGSHYFGPPPLSPDEDT